MLNRMTRYSARRRWRLVLAAAGALALVIAGVATATGSTLLTTATTAQAATSLPCDIYGGAGANCVAAYSSVRALYAAYDGPLYQVTRASDGATSDIGVLSAGGYADAAAQDSFCAGTTCTITKIYDQSPEHNDLTVAPAGAAGGANVGATANALPTTVAGHEVYGIYLPPGVGYRHPNAAGVATNGQPETMYEVASGTNINNGCCSDFGNVESTETDTGASHMDALNLSLLNAPGSTGHGPWVEADLELETLGRCLDVDGNSTTAGAKVELYDCNGVGGQQWVPEANGTILNPHSGLCLDDPSGSTANGTQLQIWTCNNESPQVFHFN